MSARVRASSSAPRLASALAWCWGVLIFRGDGGYITIIAARVDYVVVPTYDPVVVYERPRPGFFIGAAIGFRFGVVLGGSYLPRGWGLYHDSAGAGGLRGGSHVRSRSGL